MGMTFGTNLPATDNLSFVFDGLNRLSYSGNTIGSNIIDVMGDGGILTPSSGVTFDSVNRLFVIPYNNSVNGTLGKINSKIYTQFVNRQSFTISFWVGGYQNLKTPCIIGESVQGYYSLVLDLNSSPTNSSITAYDSLNNIIFTYSDNTILPINNWYNITITNYRLNDLENYSFYINGASFLDDGIDVTTVQDTLSTKISFFNPYSGNNYKLGCVLGWNKELSQSEVLQVYNATKSRYGI